MPAAVVGHELAFHNHTCTVIRLRVLEASRAWPGVQSRWSKRHCLPAPSGMGE